MFKLKFDTGNAAFEEAGEMEIARILKRVANSVEAGGDEGTIADINGNKVGSWVWEKEEE